MFPFVGRGASAPTDKFNIQCIARWLVRKVFG